MSLLDRISGELDHFGKRVQDALEVGRLQMERSRLQGVRSSTASRLGLMVFQRERGGEFNLGEYDAVMAQLDDLSARIAKVERDMVVARGEAAAAAETPAPAAAPNQAEGSPASESSAKSTGEAEVKLG